MKKILKTEQDYLDAHLKPFEIEHKGEKITGIIFVTDDKKVYLLQNTIRGTEPMNEEWKNFGFKFSWYQFHNNSPTKSAMEDVTIEQWSPKFGELVEIKCGNEWYQRIFLFEKEGMFACVYGNQETAFQDNIEFKVSFWKNVRKIEDPELIEISLEEATKIIAESKNVSVDKIKLNFKIN